MKVPDNPIEIAALALDAFSPYGRCVVRVKDNKKASEFLVMCALIIASQYTEHQGFPPIDKTLKAGKNEA